MSEKFVLRSTLTSPFGRKVAIAVSLLGFSDAVTVEQADLNDPNERLRVQNPLGKIPVLIAEDGTAYYDSRVILEYLDHRAGGDKIIPRDASARFAALRLQALCDGILDAGILIVYESRYRPADKQVQNWLDRQTDKAARGLAALEAVPPALDLLPHVGQITLACVLGYQDLRFKGGWRADHPRLVKWLAAFEQQVPAFAATKVAA